jgi:hypothetical protein
VRYPRTFATPDGESHFEDVEVLHETVTVVPGRPAFNVGAAIATAESKLLRIRADWDGDWHPTPIRWFVVTLSGELQITTSDHETRTFGPGAMCLLDDTTGKGHHTRVIGGAEWIGLGVILANQERRIGPGA